MFDKPRDPDRIEYVLDTIRQIWNRYPDLRLCQLIENCKPNNLHDMYYIEDNDLIKLLDYTYNRKGNE